MSTRYVSIAIAGGDTAQPIAMEKRLSYIRRYLRPERPRFLDCGCGAGEYVFYLVDHLGLDAHGIEYELDKVARGRRHPFHGDRIVKGDLQNLNGAADEWDYAMLNEVLEHVPDENRALKEVYRVLRVGGLLFVFSPNRWFPFESHGAYVKRLGWRVPPWFPFVPYVPLYLGNLFLDYWARNYWQTQLRRMVTEAGFSIIEKGYVWQSFEGISGSPLKILVSMRPLLRKVAGLLEATPFIKRFGISQVLVCQK